MRRVDEMELLLAALLALMIPGLLTYLVPDRHGDDTRLEQRPRT